MTYLNVSVLDQAAGSALPPINNATDRVVRDLVQADPLVCAPGMPAGAAHSSTCWRSRLVRSLVLAAWPDSLMRQSARRR